MRTFLVYTAVLASSGVLLSCDEGEVTCTVGEFRCSEDEVLEECTDDGWSEAEDCMADGLMCHEEMGHCMDPTGMTDARSSQAASWTRLHGTRL